MIDYDGFRTLSDNGRTILVIAAFQWLSGLP
jgi:hypothetical protein